MQKKEVRKMKKAEILQYLQKRDIEGLKKRLETNNKDNFKLATEVEAKEVDITPQGGNRKSEKHKFLVYLPPELFGDIKAIAEMEMRSITNMMIVLLRSAIAERKKSSDNNRKEGEKNDGNFPKKV